jgi:hypothetical protein
MTQYARPVYFYLEDTMGRAVILKLYLAPLPTTLYNPEIIAGSK